MRRRLILLSVAVVLVVLCAAVWKIARFPSVRLLVKYGLPSSTGPTGERITIEGVEFIEISSGYFLMGSEYLVKDKGDALGRICQRLGLPWGDQPEPSDEMPVHWVEFENGFWMARTEVTNEQFERFDSKHERFSRKGDRDPAGVHSWNHAKQYCAWLSERCGREVRLPSEAEWECACRGGSEDEFCFGDDEAELSRYAWLLGNPDVCVREVATKRPNRWGLYDMHGNLLEWCEDTCHYSYDGAPGNGTAWTEGGEKWRGSLRHVRRGGSVNFSAMFCRSASRVSLMMTPHQLAVGFRPAFVLTPEERKRVVGH